MRATVLLLACAVVFAACDGDVPVVPDGVPTALPGLTQSPTQIVAAPTPTVVPSPTPLKKGDEVTAGEALAQLRSYALDWRPDALFIMLANIKVGQEGRMLAMALSDPDLTDPTPGGKGRNWVLLAASRSADGVVAFDLDGAQADLVAAGRIPASLLTQLTGPGITGVDLADIGVSDLMNSDEIQGGAGELGTSAGASLALISPARLGIATLFASVEGKPTPDLLYEVFAPGFTPGVAYFDALTGVQVRQVYR